MHVLRMLTMSRVYTLAEILSKIFVKNSKENWGPYITIKVLKINDLMPT